MILLFGLVGSSESSKSGYSGNGDIVEESPAIENTHAIWWLQSGGYIENIDGVWRSIQGELSSHDKWRKIYLRKNPLDSDNGYRPQNILRLFSDQGFLAPEQDVSIHITRDNISESPNRNASSGIFLISKFLDQDNFYLAGITRDGTAVVKKKLNGKYIILAENKIMETFPESMTISLKCSLHHAGSALTIRLYGKLDGGGDWQLLADAVDNSPHGGKGLAGLRSDFFDTEFSEYQITESR